jgi:hypothetical protein
VPRIIVGEFILRTYLLDHAPAPAHVIHGNDEIRVYLADLTHSNVRGRMSPSVIRRAVAAVREHRQELIAMWKASHP